ncbi:MAG TPA: hypothetical protein VFD32_11445, partial [Dehalococcoidia bacterium]|nr:hypothetical protein [Dehalococcoidia bacterium]
MNGHGSDGRPALSLVQIERPTAFTPLGSVVGGSLTAGLEVRLDAEVDVEQMAAGRYVTVE